MESYNCFYVSFINERYIYSKMKFHHGKIVSFSNLIFIDEFLQNLRFCTLKKGERKHSTLFNKNFFPLEFQNSTAHLSQNNLKPLQYRK